ncbi:hypothetical protein [Nostoc sp. UHCC 0870]|uniref:hypothetical protein n=1 Tax=Nostoc sp. UHCC 0870 TaxID=2914041 RepID=UPI001EE04AC5|nr:hypothetical protein [Nostoc sp. UHCC 0870]UKO99347.1 hypothetical protein L6494_06440 [Nostoc sp. UHCC 0870]
MLKSISLASEFTEFFTDKNHYLYPIHFAIPTDKRGKIIGRYINALDLVLIFNYKNIFSAWEKLKNKYKFIIEYSLILSEEEGDTFVEDFLTFNQAKELIQETSRLSSREKDSLLFFLSGSI